MSASQDQPIVNKVESSGLLLLELETLLPTFEITPLDIAPQLWQGMVLKEKDFRAWVKEHDWSTYASKHVAVHCSADAIIQHWAWMLLASALAPQAAGVHFGTAGGWINAHVLRSIEGIDVSTYQDARVIVKGCGKVELDYAAYGAVSLKLLTVVKTLMYGEPCSTVPVWKRG
jgi:hypothetical protein